MSRGFQDIESNREIFIESYGKDYPYRDFYDKVWMKRAIYGDHTLMVGAEDSSDGSLLGTGSVALDVVSHSDLVGELGRLAVRSHARGRGVGKAVM